MSEVGKYCCDAMLQISHIRSRRHSLEKPQQYDVYSTFRGK